MRKMFAAGEAIVRQGDEGSEAYLIVSGKASVSIAMGGKKVPLGVRQAGEIVGEMALLDDLRRSATVTALSSVEVRIITRDELEAMLAKSPKPIVVLLKQLVARLRSTSDLSALYSPKGESE